MKWGMFMVKKTKKKCRILLDRIDYCSGDYGRVSRCYRSAVDKVRRTKQAGHGCE